MDFSSHNPLSSNSLSMAARKNDVHKVGNLLKKINPNCVDNRGWTCLHEAANSDSYKCVKVILKHPDCRPLAETHDGHTALYLACRNRCSVKTVKLLLKSVEGIANISCTEGVTPLHIVSEQGRVEIIQLLIKHGAVLDAQDFDGDTPLHEACLAKQLEAIKILLKAGANPQIQNEQLFTPFHLACSGPCLKAVSNLISYVKDVNQRIATGDTPLMIALRGNYENIINFLLDNGADPNLKNHDNIMALDIALDIGYSSTFKKLLSVTSRDAMSKNIVSRACKPHYFTIDILEALLTADLDSKFFEFVDPCQQSVETVKELKPFYYTHVPLNAYLSVAEYIYTTSQEKFREYFYLFLKRGVSVNAVDSEDFPPLSYIHYCSHSKCIKEDNPIRTKSVTQQPMVTQQMLQSTRAKLGRGRPVAASTPKQQLSELEKCLLQESTVTSLYRRRVARTTFRSAEELRPRPYPASRSPRSPHSPRSNSLPKVKNASPLKFPNGVLIT